MSEHNIIVRKHNIIVREHNFVVREHNNYCEGHNNIVRTQNNWCEVKIIIVMDFNIIVRVTEGHQLCTGFTELIAAVIVTEARCLRLIFGC